MNLRLSDSKELQSTEDAGSSHRFAHWNVPQNPLTPDRRLRPLSRVILESVIIAVGAGAILAAFSLPLPVVFALVLIGVAIPFLSWQRGMLANDQWSSETVHPVPWERQDDSTERFTVWMDVVVGAAVIGSDHGTLWFENGVLCFAGNYTSFALTSDLLAYDWEPRIAEKPLRPFQRSVRVPLRPVVGVKEWRVQFDAGPIRGRPVSIIDLKQAIRSPSDPSISADLGQLPPLATGPSCFSRSELLQLAFLHCTTILLIGVFPALLLFVFLNALSPMKWVTFVLPVIWLCAVGEGARSAVCLSFKAWRDLVRFKQNPPRIL